MEQLEGELRADASRQTARTPDIEQTIEEIKAKIARMRQQITRSKELLQRLDQRWEREK